MSSHSPEVRHLSKADPIMKRVIVEIGPYALALRAGRTPFEALARAIAHQQLHGKAAESILKRFVALFPGQRFPRPVDLLATTAESIRSAGFSLAKIAALRDLAAKAVDGTVPTSRAIQSLDDEAIIERLVQVRGVGRWTVEMLLIFHLGRPDVLPVDDFGARNGFRLAYGLDEMPSPKEVWRHGERWKPFRTAAAWYLWRASEAAKVIRLADSVVKESAKRGSDG